MRVELPFVQDYIQIEIVSVNTRGGVDAEARLSGGPRDMRSTAVRNYFATLSLCFIL